MHQAKAIRAITFLLRASFRFGGSTLPVSRFISLLSYFPPVATNLSFQGEGENNQRDIIEILMHDYKQRQKNVNVVARRQGLKNVSEIHCYFRSLLSLTITCLDKSTQGKVIRALTRIISNNELLGTLDFAQLSLKEKKLSKNKESLRDFGRAIGKLKNIKKLKFGDGKLLISMLDTYTENEIRIISANFQQTNPVISLGAARADAIVNINEKLKLYIMYAKFHWIIDGSILALDKSSPRLPPCIAVSSWTQLEYLSFTSSIRDNGYDLESMVRDFSSILSGNLKRLRIAIAPHHITYGLVSAIDEIMPQLKELRLLFIKSPNYSKDVLNKLNVSVLRKLPRSPYLKQFRIISLAASFSLVYEYLCVCGCHPTLRKVSLEFEIDQIRSDPNESPANICANYTENIDRILNETLIRKFLFIELCFKDLSELTKAPYRGLTRFVFETRLNQLASLIPRDRLRFYLHFSVSKTECLALLLLVMQKDEYWESTILRVTFKKKLGFWANPHFAVAMLAFAKQRIWGLTLDLTQNKKAELRREDWLIMVNQNQCKTVTIQGMKQPQMEEVKGIINFE